MLGVTRALLIAHRVVVNTAAARRVGLKTKEIAAGFGSFYVHSFAVLCSCTLAAIAVPIRHCSISSGAR